MQIETSLTDIILWNEINTKLERFFFSGIYPFLIM